MALRFEKINVNTLDKGLRFIRINPKSCFMQQHACEHNRTEIIARRDGVEYLECLDCRQIFEAEDLEPVTVEEEDE
jgi:Zn-finger protein